LNCFYPFLLFLSVSLLSNLSFSRTSSTSFSSSDWHKSLFVSFSLSLCFFSFALPLSVPSLSHVSCLLSLFPLYCFSLFLPFRLANVILSLQHVLFLFYVIAHSLHVSMGDPPFHETLSQRAKACKHINKQTFLLTYMNSHAHTWAYANTYLYLCSYEPTQEHIETLEHNRYAILDSNFIQFYVFGSCISSDQMIEAVFISRDAFISSITSLISMRFVAHLKRRELFFNREFASNIQSRFFSGPVFFLLFIRAMIVKQPLQKLLEDSNCWTAPMPRSPFMRSYLQVWKLKYMSAIPLLVAAVPLGLCQTYWRAKHPWWPPF